MRSILIRNFGVFALATTATTGCLLHDVNKSPDTLVTTTARFSHETIAQQATTHDRPSWWLAFDDDDLNSLVEFALDNNFELAALAARIEQALALYRKAGSELYPQLGYGADFSANWDDLDSSSDRTRSESARIRGFLNWEVDIWGKLRSLKNAQEIELSLTRLDWESARILLSASVVETYFEIQESRQQLALIRSQIAVNETLLGLTRLRFGQGQSSIVDVLQQQQQLASTRSRMPDIESRLEQLELSLDVLTGQASGGRDRFADHPISAPPTIGPVGIPSSLLTARPDLVAAQQEVIAIDYEVGAAIADRLPQLNIGGSIAYVGDPTLSTLIASAFAGLTGPLFDAGQRKAEVVRQKTRLQEALMVYSQVYLEAIRDVEIALIAERKQEEKVALLDTEWSTAQRLLIETRNRYSQGLTDYLPVLAAVSTEQNLQRDLLSSRRELLSARVALHRAIGGSTHPARRQTAALTP